MFRVMEAGCAEELTTMQPHQELAELDQVDLDHGRAADSIRSRRIKEELVLGDQEDQEDPGAESSFSDRSDCKPENTEKSDAELDSAKAPIGAVHDDEDLSDVEWPLPSGGVDRDDGDGSCSICLNDFVSGQRVSLLLECEHLFHQSCLNEWWQRSSSCPNCRETMVWPCVCMTV